MSRGLAVVAFAFVTLAASTLLIYRLRSIQEDSAAGRMTVAVRLGATATRVIYSLLVVAPFVVLILAWGFGLIPVGALAPFLTAPLAMRLGDVVSHRAGAALGSAQRESVAFLVAFLALLLLGLTVPVGAS